MLPLDAYDCVYIDGSHTSRNVLTDLVLAWGILKLQGILIIDDYTLAMFTDNAWKNPAMGIDAFLNVFSQEYKILEKGRQVIVQKIAKPDDIWKDASAVLVKL
jgi:hypothetical protein